MQTTQLRFTKPELNPISRSQREGAPHVLNEPIFSLHAFVAAIYHQSFPEQLLLAPDRPITKLPDYQFC